MSQPEATRPMNPEQPDVDPEQLAAAYVQLTTQALGQELRRLEGGTQGAGEVVHSFLLNSGLPIPEDHERMLGDRAAELRVAQTNEHDASFGAANRTMRELNETGAILEHLIRIIQTNADNETPVDPSTIVGWLRNDVYPHLVTASEAHGSQSRALFDRQEQIDLQTKPATSQHIRRTYEKVKEI